MYGPEVVAVGAAPRSGGEVLVVGGVEHRVRRESGLHRGGEREDLERRSGLHAGGSAVLLVDRVVVRGAALALGAPQPVLRQCDHLAGGRVHHGDGGPLLARVLGGNGVHHRVRRRSLRLGLHGRVDDQAAALEEVLTVLDGLAVVRVVQDLLDRVVAVEGVLAFRAAIADLLRFEVTLHRFGDGLLVLLRGDVVQRLHLGQHRVAPGLGVLGVDQRVVAHRGLHEAGQCGCLDHAHLVGPVAEVTARRGLHPVRAGAEVRDVQVAVEDLVLGEFALQLHGVPDLLQFAGRGALEGGLDLLLVAGSGHQHVADVLHGQSGRALLDRAAGRVLQLGPDEALDVDAVVLVEALVLDAHDGALHVGADLVQRHLDAVLVEQCRHPVAVGVEHVGARRQRRGGQDCRQRSDLLGGHLGGLAESGDEGHRHGGQDRAADQPDEAQAGERGHRAIRSGLLTSIRHSHQT